MLSPNDRTLLLDALRPPPGHRLDHALITTYSLDLTALLAVPLALTFHDWEEGDDGHPQVDPVGLLEALRANAEKLTVACQAGEIAVPAPQRNLFAFLEPAVVGVSAPLGGVFHPKLWVLRYEPDDASEAPVRYRLCCASRNLTYDRSWDVLLVLDGAVRPGPQRVRASLPLASFVSGVRALIDEAPTALDSSRKASLTRIADEIAHVEFDPPEGFNNLRFHPIGLAEPAGDDPFAGRRDRTLVISPFLGPPRLRALAAGESDILVSNQPELDALSRASLEGFAQAWVLREELDSEPLGPPSANGQPEASSQGQQRLAESADGLLRGLHAKLYVADAGHRARVWVGSANATGAAFASNVELLIELEASKRKCGIDAVLGEGAGGLAELLRPYRRNEEPPENRDEEEAERRADATAHQLGTAGLEMHVQGTASNGQTLALRLRAPKGIPSLPAETAVGAWPITLSPDRSCPLHPSHAEGCRWEDMETQQITAFLGLEIAARVRDAEVRRRVTVRTTLCGAPEDRDGAIVRSILDSPQRLLRYLAFLLADLDSDPPSAVAMAGFLGGEPEGADGLEGPHVPELDFPLLEGLVRALARDPKRLDRIEQLVKDLTASEQGRELLPEGFEEIWAPINAARKSRARPR